MMEWLQIVFLFCANASLILWFRSESRAEWMNTESSLKSLSAEMNREMKDFHGRLFSIEERHLQMMQRLIEKK